MSFIEDVKNIFSSSEFPQSPVFRIMMFGDRAIYFEGVKSIKSYTQEEITVTVSGGGISVFGEGLYVKQYCKGDLAICGKIKAIKKD